MRTEIAPSPIKLSDYKAPNFAVDAVHLDFDLRPGKTIVRSTLQLSRISDGDLELDGNNIALRSISVDGKALKRSTYRLTQEKLILSGLPTRCSVEIITECLPEKNTTLMGLYVSGGRYCTQCEAEGFRRITYYPDRPDVLSVFTVRIQALKSKYPYLLANGNRTEHGDLENGYHYAVWHDPFPKPCYLFALVAGEFDRLDDTFTTMSGKTVPLEIYVDPGNVPKAHYAMDALKRSMRWDEEKFGREYDLDLFMIVAVRDFNFGAMENKGLNIFNASLLLADEQSATDLNYERIESVVAHEYFHNWSGNRITCRDWFQLCLKEGFTVFRDQEFSADQRGAAVQRIKDVRALRMRQFPEDGGPLAHPVRPDNYVKIDNFYTATIYEKGAELVRMVKTILGDDLFRNGCDQFFTKYDGTAATVENFIECFEHVSGKDFSQFMLWYSQAGTPILDIDLVKTANEFKIRFSQKLQSTPGQTRKKNQVIPIRWQLVDDKGAYSEPELTLLETDYIEKSVAVSNDKISLSILQDFSAPVILKSNQTTTDYLRLMTNDPNPFNRWEAGQHIARQLICKMSEAIKSGNVPNPDRALSGFRHGLYNTLTNKEFDNNFKALSLSMPSDMEIMQAIDNSDPIAVNLANQWLVRAFADYARPTLVEIYHRLNVAGAFSPIAAAAGNRALKNKCLAMLAICRDPVVGQLAVSQFYTATNMTDELSALITLMKLGGKKADTYLGHFYDKWKDNPLVIDKWFAVQAGRDHNGDLAKLTVLTNHPDFDDRNPNRVRALIGGFAMTNPVLFHAANGTGYQFFADRVLDMDSRNPQVAARLLGVFEIWRRLDENRQILIKTELDRVIKAGPSKNVLEIALKTRG